MTAPEVAVVVPTRNRAEVCEQTVRAVLAQRDVVMEVVVIDEGSTDATPAMLTALGDERLTVVRHDRPRGLPAARNVGLALAGAPWIAFCDDDDTWAPDKLAAQLAAGSSAGAEWVVAGAVLVDGARRVIGHQPVCPPGDLLDRLLVDNVVAGGGSGVLARTEVVRALGGFDESLASCEDWDLWLRLARRGAPAVVDRPLVAYRIWPGSMSTKVERMRFTRQEVLRRAADLRADRGAPDGTFEHERWLAKQVLRGGDRVGAARAYARLAIAHRRPGELLRAAGSLAVPDRLAAAGDARAAAAVPAAWTREVAAWFG